MNWLKENWFKGGIVFAALIVALPTAYYYGYIMPKSARNTEAEMFRAENLKCKEKGFSDYRGKIESENGWTIVSDYVFNSQHQACLAYYDVSAFETGFHKQSITNIDTGRLMYEWNNESNGSADCKKVLDDNLCLTFNEMQEKIEELFGK